MTDSLFDYQWMHLDGQSAACNRELQQHVSPAGLSTPHSRSACHGMARGKPHFLHLNLLPLLRGLSAPIYFCSWPNYPGRGEVKHRLSQHLPTINPRAATKQFVWNHIITLFNDLFLQRLYCSHLRHELIRAWISLAHHNWSPALPESRSLQRNH